MYSSAAYSLESEISVDDRDCPLTRVSLAVVAVVMATSRLLIQQPEVGQLTNPASVDEHVTALQVAMVTDAALV